MSMKKVGSIEIYELDENLDKYTRKEREEYINELFKQEYRGKEISYLLNGEEIKALYKIIKCNDCFFYVIIDILERNGNYYIYNTKLKEVDARALSPGMISTSSTTNIS